MGPAVAVIVAARDAERTLGDTLDGLAAQDVDAPYEVVVVDNGSRDGTAELAERHPLKPRVLRRRRGEGPGAARNDGVAATSAPVIAFTDSDCRPTPGWLAAGLRAMASADLVQGYVSPPDGARPGPFDHTLWVVSEYGLYETANLFVRREYFDRVGGFEDWVNADRRNGAKPERPFGEDVLLAWRMRRLGARTAFAHEAVVHHAILPGTARGYLSERARVRLFPALVARVPELRGVFLHRGLFLTRRSLRFDAAVAGVLLAAATRRPWPLAAVLPYAALVRAEAGGRTPGERRRVAATHVAADAIAFGGLLAGSARSRTVVL